jgi:hypothetical protein
LSTRISQPKNQTAFTPPKHHFELAAYFYFFLGQLMKCVNICLQRLRDWSARVGGGRSGPDIQNILLNYVLPKKAR